MAGPDVDAGMRRARGGDEHSNTRDRNAASDGRGENVTEHFHGVFPPARRARSGGYFSMSRIPTPSEEIVDLSIRVIRVIRGSSQLPGKAPRAMDGVNVSAHVKEQVGP